jgi:hypothetical protein
MFYQERQAPITASHDQAKIRKSKMDNVVKRLSLLMVFYCATVYLTYGSMAYLLNKAEAFKTSLERYFYCSIFQPNCPPGKWNKHLNIEFQGVGVAPVKSIWSETHRDLE